MPHSTTKRHRPKRPDDRPNGKSRNKSRLAAVEKMEAKDLIRTRIPKALHKERQVTGVLRQAPRKKSSTIESRIESRVRSLQKLLRQIEQLGEKRAAGEVLNAAQLEKLGRQDSIVAELEEIEELLVDEDSDDIEEEEVSSQASEEDEEEDDKLGAFDENAKRAIQSNENHKKKKKKKTSQQ